MKTIIEKRMCARMDLLNPFVATVMPAMIAIKETITLNTAPKKTGIPHISSLQPLVDARDKNITINTRKITRLSIETNCFDSRQRLTKPRPLLIIISFTSYLVFVTLSSFCAIPIASYRISRLTRLKSVTGILRARSRMRPRNGRNKSDPSVSIPSINSIEEFAIIKRNTINATNPSA